MIMKKIKKAKKSKSKLETYAFRILKSKTVEYVELDVSMGDVLRQWLVGYAKQRITQDESALLSWAMTDIIRSSIAKGNK